LRFFESDESRLSKIKEEYGSGKMLTGEVKQILVSVIQELVKKHQEARAKVTDDDVKYFMSRRALKGGNITN